MALVLSAAEHSELWQDAAFAHPSPTNGFEVEKMPACLGQGYIRSMEVVPGVWLDIWNFEYENDLLLRVSVHDHPVQCLVLLSGLIHHEDVYPTVGGTRSYLSGSGISPAYTAKYQRCQRLLGVNIHLEPEILEPFLLDQSDCSTNLTTLLIRNNEWKTSFFPDVTLLMQRVVQQILKTPFQGIAAALSSIEKADGDSFICDHLD